MEINFSLRDGDLLSTIGIKNIISYGLTPAIDQFMQIRLQELSGGRLPVVSRLNNAHIELPTNLAVAMKPSQAGAFLAELEKVSNHLEKLDQPLWFSAKRIDYLVGDQYVPGRVCDLPIVGGISN
ncbi:MAG: hypothetical protein D4R65_06020, partial [Verrucomicrobiaceae bacterium]